jgi:large subunit ribosomal protein L9
MKVILLQELKGRGGEGDVVDVARGFAVNYLLPRKAAIEATKGNLKQLGQRAHNIKAREDQRLGDAQSVFDRLNGKAIRVEAKVGEEGRLFGSVTSNHIVAAIAEQLRLEVDRRKIETHGSIKEVGPHVVNVAIYRDVKAELTVEVIGEGQAAAAPAVPTTVVEVVEGIDAANDAFVEVVEETPEQEEADLALEEADAEVAETVSDEAAE